LCDIGTRGTRAPAKEKQGVGYTLHGSNSAPADLFMKELSLYQQNLKQMDIQTTKLELMRLVLNTRKEQVLQRIMEIFEQEEEADFWDELSSEDQSAIDEGLEQLNKGQYVSHESVREEIKSRF
jgi:hypothetical protein